MNSLPSSADSLEQLLFLEPIGGISGDMLVGAMLDLGVPFSWMTSQLHTLNLSGLQFQEEKQKRHHLQGTRFLVQLDAVSSIQDHRAYRDIQALIGSSDLSASVQHIALQIFEQLALVEAEIHGVKTESVEFHEIGAGDSIADIVSIALGLDYLKINAIYVTPVPLGSGSVQTAHGSMPLPAPATLKLLKGFPVVYDGFPFERTTPTGAAVIAAFAKPVPARFEFVPNAVGMGIGSHDMPQFPNILRCTFGTRSLSGQQEIAVEIIECSETNVDDCSAEWLGFAHERLIALGVLDVCWIPIQMKKNRPGIQIQVLHSPELRLKVHQMLFQETSTLGIRYTTVSRTVVPHEALEVQTPWGTVRGKKVDFQGIVRFNPEYEDCRKIAFKENIPLPQIYQTVMSHFYQQSAQHKETNSQ